jgi:hypothetical protein
LVRPRQLNVQDGENVERWSLEEVFVLLGTGNPERITATFPRNFTASPWLL